MVRQEAGMERRAKVELLEQIRREYRRGQTDLAYRACHILEVPKLIRLRRLFFHWMPLVAADRQLTRFE